MTEIKLYASGANRWVHCPGSAKMCADEPPDPDRTARDEGIEAHRTAQAAIIDRKPSGDRELDIYVNDVLDTAGGSAVRTEHWTTWGPLNTRMAVDAHAWKGQELIIWELKWGHTYVPALNNYQLLIYANALLSAPGAPTVTHVNMRIVQPRSYHPNGPVRYWRAPVERVKAQAREVVLPAIQNAKLPTPDIRSGNHCRYCKAAYKCEACDQATCAAIDYAGLANDYEMLPRRLGYELTVLERAAHALETRRIALEAHADRLIRDGTPVPGWQIGVGPGRTVWKLPDNQVLTTGDLSGVDLRNPRPMTPNQAIAAGVPEAIVNSLTERRAGKPKLMKINTEKHQQIINGGE